MKCMKVIKAKRLLTSKELQDYLIIDNPKKSKKFLEDLHKELFTEEEYERTRR